MSTILIAGGSGLVGTRLQQILIEQGHQVRLLSRRADKHKQQFQWNPQQGQIDESALQGVDCLINLAGAGIADKPWTPERKKELIDSRVMSNQLLAKTLEKTGFRPKLFIAASAIGYYGNSGEQWMHEDSEPVDESFMVDCCRQWEASAVAVSAHCARSCTFRIGVVMAKESGAFAEFAKPMQLGLGAYFGDGSAWFPWIHIDDLCNMFIWAMENEQISGVYNAVGPKPARGKEIVVALRKAISATALLVPAPTFAIRLFFGEMSAVILNSNRVSADRVIKAGFRFKHPELEEALEAVYTSRR